MMPAMSRAQAVAMAQKEREGLSARLAVSRESIKLLEEAQSKYEDSTLDVTLCADMLGGIIAAQLAQLGLSVREGEARLAELDKFIAEHDSVLAKATLIGPDPRSGGVSR